jgi:hypothetical protein
VGASASWAGAAEVLVLLEPGEARFFKEGEVLLGPPAGAPWGLALLFLLLLCWRSLDRRFRHSYLRRSRR